MKKIFFLISVLFLIDSISAQHKTLTLYYPNDSTNVVNISNLDSMLIFICSASKVNYGGKDYNTVLISNQCWLKENLDIGTRLNGSANSLDNGIIEKYCYNNDPANCTTYGGLYQWEEAMQYVTTEGAKGICPTGWHLPTLAEFTTLNLTVSGDGNSLKAIGQGSGSGAGTNTTGFSALLAGHRTPGGSFEELTTRTHYWTSTLDGGNPTQVHHIYLWDLNSNISFHNGAYAGYGFSLRCIKD